MISLFNTLSKKKEIFKPLDEKKIKMYVCGMTVYDHCHLGHARVLIVFDLIYRWFLDSGYDVIYVRNITDIDDKIIAKSIENDCDYKQITKTFIDSMNLDSQKLNILPPSSQPKATDFILEMINMITKLISEGYAYSGVNGDIFFDISKFDDYCKLSKKKLDELESGIRVGLDKNKKNSNDFVLWKLSKPNEPFWESPWGNGRPGWHIECSAMSSKFLGKTFDLHGGGQDLIFPHHENEIAQSESCHGQVMANYWVHNGFVNVDNEKMSKSLGNFFTLKEILKKYSGDVVRFFILKSHYRSPLNYSDKNLDDAEMGLKKIHLGLRKYSCSVINIDWDKDYLIPFKKALDDDFNSPKALAVIFDLINKLNKVNDQTLASEIYSLLNKIGLMSEGSGNLIQDSSNVDENKIEKIINDRLLAKKQKDYIKADELRRDAESLGVILEDTKDGTIWRNK
jgi:cysteinyl-tRNA synthetase